jgi:IS30 family transposase
LTTKAKTIPGKLTEADKRLIYQWRDEGVAIYIIAQRLNVAPRAIQHHLERRFKTAAGNQ